MEDGVELPGATEESGMCQSGSQRTTEAQEGAEWPEVCRVAKRALPDMRKM